MHIVMKNEESGETEGVVCVTRETQTCIILQADMDNLDDLANIALAMKVPRVLLFVPKDNVKQLEPFGWRKTKDLVLLEKGG